ncbi:MAG: hypothetical protein JSW04_15885 [Desulfobacterales bacterium]|nr:MAG: hypothetical protein JSW04_15885 [Desulfobacterales bacterium]
MVVFFLLLVGCGGVRSKPSESAIESVKEKQDTATYYHEFEDILLPKELKIDNRSTYVVQAPGFLTGVLALKGRVDRNSLIVFFKNNMEKDNWRSMGSFKSPRTSTILLFQKENRWCVININEKEFYTYVEIGVAPNLDDAESGLLK